MKHRLTAKESIVLASMLFGMFFGAGNLIFPVSMGLRVGRPYAYFFTCLLYLAIGPLFAIPRTATVSFSVGLALHAAKKD